MSNSLLFSCLVGVWTSVLQFAAACSHGRTRRVLIKLMQRHFRWPN